MSLKKRIGKNQENKKTNWEKISTISNIILSILTFVTLIVAIYSAYIANRGLETQRDFYNLETIPKIALLIDFNGLKTYNLSSNWIEIKIKDFLNNPHLTIQFYNEGRVPILVGSVAVIGECLRGTWMNKNGFNGITVLGDSRLVKPFDIVKAESIDFTPYLDISKLPCEISLVTQQQNKKYIGSKILLK